MADQWNEHLKCPSCRRAGEVNLCQAEGENSPSVLWIADGFKVIHTEYGPDFHCAACDLAAIP